MLELSGLRAFKLTFRALHVPDYRRTLTKTCEGNFRWFTFLLERTSCLSRKRIRSPYKMSRSLDVIQKSWMDLHYGQNIPDVLTIYE